MFPEHSWTWTIMSRCLVYQYLGPREQENNVDVHHLAEDCPDDSVDLSAENDDISDAIFLSTYKDEPQQSSDDEPIYDDGDWYFGQLHWIFCKWNQIILIWLCVAKYSKYE